MQRAIASFLFPAAQGELLDCCHGYRPGRSSRSNAQPHCGATWVQKADIQDFFASSSPDMVKQLFESLGLNSASAELLADLTTVDDGLPLGAPSSPVISNLLLASADESILKLCDARNISYTRYADDLTFSSSADFDVLDSVSQVIERHGYVLNAGKSVKRQRGQSLQVTGLVIWDGATPRLPKRFKRRLEQELYYSERFGLESHAEHEYDWHWIDIGQDPERFYKQSLMHLSGKIYYARGVEPEWVKKLESKFPGLQLLHSPQANRSEVRARVLGKLVEHVKAMEPLVLEHWDPAR